MCGACNYQTEDLESFAGRFKNGYTPESFRDTALDLNKILGIDLVCVWEYFDTWGTGGDSEVYLADGRELRNIPESLWELLIDGKTSNLTTIQKQIAKAKDSGLRVSDLMSVSTSNFAMKNNL